MPSQTLQWEYVFLRTHTQIDGREFVDNIVGTVLLRGRLVDGERWESIFRDGC